MNSFKFIAYWYDSFITFSHIFMAIRNTKNLKNGDKMK